MIDLQKEISQALSEYTDEVTEELDEAKKKVAKESAKTLKRTSPSLTGDYAKGWRAKKVGNAWVVHNKTDYQLTHLLEKGHAKRGGGRVPAQPHIRPVEQEAIEEFENRIERAIRG
ncbi:HK97 gp10 family phage protein [Salibacterium lacus]|uniref:HK97 gp10 family phage protein n=1 Tax=Salibacterium lacus TaxID=1898109 RepID=A0ABW5T1P6_9BACI